MYVAKRIGAVAGILLLFFVVGCDDSAGAGNGGGDMGAGDAAVPASDDLAVPVDLATPPDLTVPDLSVPTDMLLVCDGDAGLKICGSACIASTGCCTASDCPGDPNGQGTAVCDGNHVCQLGCNPGYRQCGNQCIPGDAPDGGFPDGGVAGGFTDGGAPASCCNASDCPAVGEVCPAPGATCACPTGQTLCSASNSCIPSGNCCTASDCPSVGNGTATCTAGVCGFTCNTGYSQCNGSCQISTAQCCTASDCSSNNIAPACTSGTCSGVCNAGWADCNNNKQTDGCETGTTSDPNNCGSCGNVCSLPNATAGCTNSTCTVTSCNSGFADCNGNPADGCETSTTNNTNACGACGNICTLPNATASCSNSMCTIGSCNTGFADCNRMPADGCEINTTNNPADCGGCGNVCSVPNATAACTNSACSVGSCNPGFADCNGSPGDGCEINTTNNVNDCGACGNVCNLPNATATCTSSACAIASCNAGWADCNGNPADGCETNISANPADCGGCGMVCATANGTPACMAGVCVTGSCNPGFADCNGNPADGCEINTTNNPSDCGGCGNVCTEANATAACSNSMCAVGSCNPGFADCNSNPADGCEINTTNDPRDCGGCGNVCTEANATAACTNSMCAVGSCSPGFADCNSNPADGCEINTTNNPNDCGGCGVVCSSNNIPTPACSGGTCDGTCAAGTYDVDGNKQTDGCECAAPNTNTCSTPTNVGSIAVGASTTLTGVIPGTQAEQWYVVSWAADTTTTPPNYHPHVTVTTTTGTAVVFDVVEAGTCSAPVYSGCGTEGGNSASKTAWETSQTGGNTVINGGTQGGGFTWVQPGNIGQLAPGTTLLIRVHGTSATSCTSYSITFQNG